LTSLLFTQKKEFSAGKLQSFIDTKKKEKKDVKPAKNKFLMHEQTLKQGTIALHSH